MKTSKSEIKKFILQSAPFSSTAKNEIAEHLFSDYSKFTPRNLVSLIYKLETHFCFQFEQADFLDPCIFTLDGICNIAHSRIECSSDN